MRLANQRWRKIAGSALIPPTFLNIFSSSSKVQAHLLSVLSPFLGSLLAQAGPDPTLSLPCSENILRSIFLKLYISYLKETFLLRDLFASLLKGKGLKRKESVLAALLGFQGEPELALVDEPPDVKVEQIGHFQKTEKIVEKKCSAAMNLGSLMIGSQNESGDDEKQDPAYAPNQSLHDASYPCGTCRKKFNSEQGLKSHSQIHTVVDKGKKKSGERALCNVCSKSFATKYILKTHMLGHTSDKKSSEKLVCEICSKSFSNKYVLKYHKISHTDDGKEKSLCNLCSTWTLTLKNHMKHMHGENKYVPCSTCGVDYTISSLSKHQKLCNSTAEEREARKVARAKKCDQCGKVLSNISKLKKHMKTAHKK